MMSRQHRKTPAWVRKLIDQLPPTRWVKIDPSEPGTYGGSVVGFAKCVWWFPCEKNRRHVIGDVTITLS